MLLIGKINRNPFFVLLQTKEEQQQKPEAFMQIKTVVKEVLGANYNNHQVQPWQTLQAPMNSRFFGPRTDHQ